MFYSQLGARLSLKSHSLFWVNLTYFNGPQLCLLSSHLTLSLVVPYLCKYTIENGFLKWVQSGRCRQAVKKLSLGQFVFPIMPRFKYTEFPWQAPDIAVVKCILGTVFSKRT